jgi:hypothetical protein
MRIVSLSPAATEIVHAIGQGRKLVGISHDSDWPLEARAKPVVTRPTVRLDGRRSRTVHRLTTEAIAAGRPLVVLDEVALASLRPDLVLAGDRCPRCGVPAEQALEAVRRLGLDAMVIGLEPTSIEGTFHSISTVGAMAGAEASAMRLVERLRGRLGRIERKVEKRRDAGRAPVRVVALEWLDPPMTAGRWVPGRFGGPVAGTCSDETASPRWNELGGVTRSIGDAGAGALRPRRARGRRGVGEDGSATLWHRLVRPTRGRCSWSRGGLLRAGPASSTASVLAEIFDDPSSTPRRSRPGRRSTRRGIPAMPFRATFSCLWCGTSHATRGPDDIEGWAQLCPGCLGRAGDNEFLRFRLRAALDERGRARPVPRRGPAPAQGDDWYLRRGAHARGAIEDARWAADLDAATLWLDSLPLAGVLVEPVAGDGWWSPLLAGKGELWVHDADPAALERARARLLAHGLRAHLHERDPWSEPDRPADVLFTAFWLGRLDRGDVTAWLELARRWLRPDGRYVLLEPGTQAGGDVAGIGGDAAPAGGDGPSRFEPEDLAGRLGAAGFAATALESGGSIIRGVARP